MIEVDRLGSGVRVSASFQIFALTAAGNVRSGDENCPEVISGRKCPGEFPVLIHACRCAYSVYSLRLRVMCTVFDLTKTNGETARAVSVVSLISSYHASRVYLIVMLLLDRHNAPNNCDVDAKEGVVALWPICTEGR